MLWMSRHREPRGGVAIQDVDCAGPGANVGRTYFPDCFPPRLSASRLKAHSLADDAVRGIIRGSLGVA